MSHFYERNNAGEIIPRHFVGMTSRPGELRPTRIADAKKHGWTPSVTTIQGMLDKPALTNWKIDEHLKQTWKLREQAPYAQSQEQWIEFIKHSTQTELDKAPKDGTDFHDVLEKWFNKQEVAQEFVEICGSVQSCVTGNTQTIAPDFITEKSFVHPLGFAGKCDIHSPDWVIDYKTKNSCDKWKPGKMHYPEMAMQLAAYRVGLGLDNARCANVFVCLEDGAVEFHEWDSAELDKQFANFTDLLRIWLRNAGYIPGKPQ